MDSHKSYHRDPMWEMAQNDLLSSFLLLELSEINRETREDALEFFNQNVK